ncbi:triose-phosphate isomerase [Silicimonas algicola]|uniref:Triosephosphate isomerase n=1 Tax=Silicimonas algicola TaxID=1826607 RepID=A0A316GC28_9RHOB|nr:triose-phosphate isomerase [Silicimonas algicola]AZQ67817.1 triose-phosphate isomerase [Silicimonas algicola]PWK57765.1 triosephosphate isomerase [Silicimonas algicola]
MQKLAAGNWKMNGLAASLAEIEALATAHPTPGCDILICPPATLLSRVSDAALGTSVQTGAQDCHPKDSGAHTGDISAAMVRDAGGAFVIVGHSERRADHGEDDALVRAKAEAAHDAGLIAIVCVGETLEQREAGRTLEVVGGQVAGSLPDDATAEDTVIAYEPVWAIGTGKVPTTDEIALVHADIRARLTARFGADGEGMRIIYGGSVKASNAAEIFAVPNVDGALVGGASLKAADFGGIVDALGAA